MMKKHPVSAGLDRILIAILGAAFVLILVVLPVHAFMSTWGGTEIGPLLVWKSWKEILLAALVPLVALYCTIRKDIAKIVWSSLLTKLILAYVFLHVLFAIISSASPEAVISGLLMNLRFLAIFILAQILWASDRPWVQRIKKWVPNWLFITTIVVSIIAIAQITILPRDFLVMFGYGPDTIPAYLMVDENPNALRAFATMRGPNPLGAYLLLPLALAFITIINQRRNWLAVAALVLGMVALALSGARSAWLGAFAALIVVAAIFMPRDKLIKTIKIAAVPALIFAALFLWLAANVPALRLVVFRSSPTDPHLLEGSTEKHWQETSRGFMQALANPLGQGIGTAGPASFYNANDAPDMAENYFVQIAQEVGFIGLILFLAISVIVVLSLWRLRYDVIRAALLASFIGINVINLFLHGWADDPTAMTWWALAGLFVAAEDNG